LGWREWVPLTLRSISKVHPKQQFSTAPVSSLSNISRLSDFATSSHQPTNTKLTMNHGPYDWGRPSDDTYGAYNHQIAAANNSQFPKMNTQQPIVTGTSVIAVKYQDGIVLAADNLGSYGSLARFSDIERLLPVGDSTIVGISGDISDLQQIERILDDLQVQDSYDMEKPNLKPEHVHEYLSRVFYNRRSKMDPLWNSTIVAGLSSTNELVLKYADLLGVTYSSPAIATGFGAHLAIPLLRRKVETEEDASKLTEEEAVELVRNCMKVLFYRDARSIDKYSLAVISQSRKKIDIHKGLRCEDMKWEFAKHIRGYGAPQL